MFQPHPSDPIPPLSGLTALILAITTLSLCVSLSKPSPTTAEFSNFHTRLILTFCGQLLKCVTRWILATTTAADEGGSDEEDEIVIENIIQKLRTAGRRTKINGLNRPPSIPERKSSLGFSVRDYRS
ncbi:hypothetical protein QBC43DRAFT_288636 [Cladorrhinum sp. PSN259]|nr:hypothetical protein QBC43DRAFT_288636 [Cladorrhinum sp. PSN259]